MAVSFFILMACNKEEDIHTSLQHKWSVNNVIFKIKTAQLDTTYTYVGEPQDYFDFRNDGKIYRHLDNQTDTSVYQWISDTELLVEEDTFMISVITNTQLQLRYLDSLGGGSYFQNLYNLTR